ncbi:MAG: hypothetical protein F2529_02420 [Actinobacteria bacterium]|uniref:Unannotated protein n=1 Tax=freshwater metagenome TaxID=449393 RepID=A0A6J6BMC1_9ZZZZ|nr:hypothetical protein [Actinomycetota bacterium]MTA29746.1 hypothetical protein [Actinomycetota bacterium]
MATNNVKPIRKVLQAGSIVFGLSAIALVATPQLFNQLLGLVSTADLDWSMRMTGITLVALSGNMFSHSKRGTDSSVMLAARVMFVSAAALGVLTLLIPVTLTWFTILYAIVGFSFSAAYGYLLFIKK